MSDPHHEFVKTLVYIYSMESFVFAEMNKASREKDTSKIEFYGPFASALGFIVHCGNYKQTEFTNEIIVYRGLRVSSETLDEKYKIGNVINLQGFTSSTISRETAKTFAFDDETILEDDPNRMALLIEI